MAYKWGVPLTTCKSWDGPPSMGLITYLDGAPAAPDGAPAASDGDPITTDPQLRKKSSILGPRVSMEVSNDR